MSVLLVPMDLDVRMKATLLGAVFLIVSPTADPFVSLSGLAREYNGSK